MTSRLARLIASFFYVGFIPIIPGTFGSLAAFLIYFPLTHYIADWRIQALCIIFITGIGIWASHKAQLDAKIEDPSFVVIDEVAGQLITLFLVPFSWTVIIVGFLLFRILDIIKPAPARKAEDLPGGWGIMMDDVIAGVYGNILLSLGVYLTKYFWQ
jgi:phosphatidylglycerophosphatase A